MSEFSKLSLSLTEQLSKKEKKDMGIYFTPRKIVRALIENLPQREFGHIIEPSCGSGEFLRALDVLATHIDAIELNDIIFDATVAAAGEIPYTSAVVFHKANFLEWGGGAAVAADLVIGNPPYYVCSAGDIPRQYKKYIAGRPNIFCAFILHAHTLLASGGIMAFVLPKSFMNSAYYSSIRSFLVETGTILNILDFAAADFLDTEQQTIGFIYQKGGGTNGKYVFSRAGGIYFTTAQEKLEELCRGSTTLEELGLSVKTGTVVWNEKKQLLTDNDAETLLIYNSNLSGAGTPLQFPQFRAGEKKQYIRAPARREPAIVVNRGNGNAKYVFNYSFIDGTRPYLVENHLNFISASAGARADFNRVLNSFANPKTMEFIELFCGNNALSKTELEKILPIY